MISTFILKKHISNSIKILVKNSNSNICTHFTWDIKFYDDVYVFFINISRQMNPSDLIQMKKKNSFEKIRSRNISMQTMNNAEKNADSVPQSHQINMTVASSDAVVIFDLFS